MNQTQLDGITKARIAANISQVSTGNLYADDAAYITAVCASVNIDVLPVEAADSYATQFASKTILELETELAAAITTTTAQPNPPELPTPTIAGVPQVISKRQGRAQLKEESLLAPVEGYMASLAVDDNTRMAYEDASEWTRNDVNVIGMMAMLGKSGVDCDAFFTAAALL